jgi:hypothetical protein
MLCFGVIVFFVDAISLVSRSLRLRTRIFYAILAHKFLVFKVLDVACPSL